MTDLLDSVQALTRPIRSKVLMTNDAGISCTTPVVLAPLLDQLDAAIRGTVGVGGAGALANERNMLNADALYRASMITTLVKDWARIVGIQTRPTDLPGPLLDQWYVLFMQKVHSAELVRWHERKMQEWANSIEGMLDPPRTRDLPNACPICEADTWWLNGNEYPRPLILTFHDGPRMIEDGKGLCRSCEAVFGMRELSYALDEQEQEKSA